MKFKLAYFAIPLALALVSCSKPTSTEFTSNSLPVVDPTPTPTPTASPTPSPTPSTCTSTGQTPLFIDSNVTGTGAKGMAVANFRKRDPNATLIADTKLRVQVMPNAVSSNKPYTKVGVKVALWKNTDWNAFKNLNDTSKAPLAVATLDGGTQTFTDSLTLKKGVTNGAKSAIIDFSNYLVALNQGEEFTVVLSEFQSDYLCKTLCTVENYGVDKVGYAAGYCTYPTNNLCPTTAHWNYLANVAAPGYGACCGHISAVCVSRDWYGNCLGYQNQWVGDKTLEVCQQKKCGVGPLATDDTTSPWSFQVFVETGSTTCL